MFVNSFGRSYIRIKLESDELNKSFQKDSIMPSPIGNDKDIAKTQVSDFLAITLSEMSVSISFYQFLSDIIRKLQFGHMMTNYIAAIIVAIPN